MSEKFRYFVIFAEMRTGSNFLESNLNAFEGIECFGEAFNPAFPGYPNREELLGLTLTEREKNPHILLEKIATQTDVMGGFRYFSDHDPRVFDTIIKDKTCAKVILTRNPIESFVSWKIAQATGQWKLTNVKRRKESKIEFNPQEFQVYLNQVQKRQETLISALQKIGQTAFYLSYDTLNSLDVINGLVRFLGINETQNELDLNLKPQNPSPLSDKVENYDQMRLALQKLDPFVLSKNPNFEPQRGPMVPKMVATNQAGVLFMPIPGGPNDTVEQWMADLDSVARKDLIRGLGQSAMRNWMEAYPGHKKFTVLRHPLARAHDTFCRKILSDGDEALPMIQKRLRNFYKLPIPGNVKNNYSLDDHRVAFIAFLNFIKQNLALQTSIRIDRHWASQMSLLQGMVQFMLPDLILREDTMMESLPKMARELFIENIPAVMRNEYDFPYSLDQIYDDEIESLSYMVYKTDYTFFGFSSWK